MKRISIRLSESINDYFNLRSVTTGQPVSSLIAITLTEYVEAKLGIETLQELMKKDKAKEKKQAKENKLAENGTSAA